MPTIATLIGYVASGLVLLDWLPPVLGLNLLLLTLGSRSTVDIRAAYL
jgi:hypothetical protein